MIAESHRLLNDFGMVAAPSMAQPTAFVMLTNNAARCQQKINHFWTLCRYLKPSRAGSGDIGPYSGINHPFFSLAAIALDHYLLQIPVHP